MKRTVGHVALFLALPSALRQRICILQVIGVRSCESVVGGEVTLATVMLGDGSKDSGPHVDATFLFSLDSHLADRRGKYCLGD